MRVLAVAWRDLKRAASAPVGIVLMLSVPLILTAIIGLSFGSSERPARMPRVRLLVLDRDKSFISQFITAGLRQERLADYVDPAFVGEEGVDLIRKGKASALLIIPSGFSDSVLAGREASLELVKNPAERFLPVVADHGVRLLTTGLDAVALLLENELDTISGAQPATVDAGAERASGIAGQISRKLYHLGNRLSPLPMRIELVGKAESAHGLGVFGLVLPGLTVLMLMMVAQKLLREVTEEHENGMLAALLASPLSPLEYAAGKTGALLVVIALGFVLLLPAGALLFGINWGNPAGVILVAASFSVATAGVMMLLAGLTRTARQAEALGIMVVLVMGLVGGSMVPFRAEHGPLAVLARMTPNRWAIDGFLEIMSGEPPRSILREVAVLFGGGVVLLVAGAGALLHKVSR